MWRTLDEAGSMSDWAVCTFLGVSIGVVVDVLLDIVMVGGGDEDV